MESINVSGKLQIWGGAPFEVSTIERGDDGSLTFRGPRGCVWIAKEAVATMEIDLKATNE